MKMHLDCPECFVRQAIRTGQLLRCPNSVLWDLVKGCGTILSQIEHEFSPPQNAVALYDMISLKVGKEDPFYQLKKESTQQALALYPRLKEKIKNSADPLDTALRLAACGNVVDYGVSSDFDLMKEVEEVFNADFFHYEYEEFAEKLHQVDWILYIGDNCGESVFDRMLIEELGIPVKYAVRGGPIINDVTKEDAVDAGIDQVAEIVSTGCRAPGIVFDWCSDEFKALYDSAPMIISKGQGNFETLSDEKREIFFIFKIKCKVVASFLDSPLNSMFFGRTKTVALDPNGS